MGLAGTAKDTLRIVDERGYISPSGKRVDLTDRLRRAIDGTVLYRPAELERLVADHASAARAPSAPMQLEVTSESTSQAGARLVAVERLPHVLALNFASAKNPGGGFLGGAKAQEEDLARCSALYTCQLTQRAYYDANRACGSMLYTDHMIYSPDVPFFRDDGLALLDDPFDLSVLTAPAPNAGEYLRGRGRDRPLPAGRAPAGAAAALAEALESRARMVLSVARAKQHRVLVLGAWGCGVFRNDPTFVADVFGRHLASPAFAGEFDRVVFAIYDRSARGATLGAFRARFPG